MSMKKLLVAAALLTTVGAPVHAATQVVYGDNVKFTYDDATLYGTAMTVGNSIFFLPTEFRAESPATPDYSPTASATLNITVESLDPAQYLITEFTLVEQGDYFLDGSSAEVTAGGRLQVSSNTTLCGLIVCIDSDTFDATGLTVQNATTNWTTGGSVSLADTLGWGSDTSVVAQIQNNLSASADAGDQAWIQKKAQLVGLSVSVVPVPAAVWLFVSGLGMLAGMRRFRSQA